MPFVAFISYISFMIIVHFFNRVSSSAAIASPTSAVLDEPPMSPVRTPLSIVIRVASSIFSASSGRHSEYLNIMLMDRMVAIGFTIPWPAISGAEPIHC
jgi:hypothetical protein